MALVVKSQIANITGTGVGPLLSAPAGTVLSSIVVQGKQNTVFDIEVAVDGESTYRIIYKNPSNGELVAAPIMFEAGDTVRYNCVSHDEDVVILVSYAYDSVNPGGQSIDVLSDVNTSSVPPVDGQVLQWNDANDEWRPATVSGGGGGSTTLAGLDDTNIQTPLENNFLVYNGTHWANNMLYATAIELSSSNDSTVFAALDELNTGATAITAVVTGLQTDVSDLTTGVSSLTTLVDANTTGVTTNSTNIAANASGIAANAGDIVILTDDLNTAEAAIADHETRITANEGDIADHETRITANESDIANFSTTVEGLSDVNFGTYSSSVYKLMAWYPTTGEWIPAELSGYNGISDIYFTPSAGAPDKFVGLGYGLKTLGSTNYINFTASGDDDDLADMTFAYSNASYVVKKMDGNTIRSLIKKLTETVKNVSGATILRGTPIHVTGSSGQQAEVVPATASGNFPAHYIADEDINDGASGLAVAIGLIEDVDLTPFGDSASNYSEGDEVYLGASGGFTTTRPTGTNAVQLLGVVLKVNTSGNQISGMITGMGRVNSLPNLADGYVWIGDSNGVPQQVDSSTLGGGGGGSTTINNNANNRIITGSDTANTLNAETGLTWGFDTLTVDGEANIIGEVIANAVSVKDITYTGGINISTPNNSSFPAQGEISPIGGSGLTAGQLYYLNSSGVWTLADATAEASCKNMLGIAVSQNDVMIRGHLCYTAYAGFTDGEPLYVKPSSTGDITNIVPFVSGHIVRKIGFSLDGSVRSIYFNPSNDYFEVE